MHLATPSPDTLIAWATALGGALPSGVANGYAANAREEMAPWRARGVHAADLERSLSWSSGLQRYQILDKTFYRVPRPQVPGKEWLEGHRVEFEAMLARLILRPGCPCPDLDLVVNLGDSPAPGSPVFSRWVRDELNPRLPSSAHWDTGGAESDSLGAGVRCHRIFEPDALRRPFAERVSKVVWRGTATGMWDRDVRMARLRDWLGASWGSGLSRVALVRLAERHPEVLDAAFTGFSQLSAKNASFLSARLRTEAWVDQSWFLRHRYVVNVDGNVATWSFLTLLGTGSVVLRQQSPYREFCTPQLEAARPWIPVARDLSDLLERARDCLAQKRAEEMRALADEARAFALRWLSGSAVDFYMASLIAQYASAFRGPVARVPSAVPVATRVM